MNMLRSTLIAALASCLALACGTLSSSDDQPAVNFGSVRGQVNNAAGVPITSGVRAAIMWFGGGDKHYRAQSVPLGPNFPESLEVKVNELPPAGAIWPQGFASGNIVVYEDRNGDGKLDMVTPGEPAYRDLVIGVVDGARVVFLESASVEAPFEATDGSQPGPGFSLLVTDLNPPPCGDPDGCPPPSSYKPIDTAVTLRMTTAWNDRNFACETWELFGPGGPETMLPEPQAVRHPAGEMPAKFAPDISDCTDPRTLSVFSCQVSEKPFCRYGNPPEICSHDIYTLAPSATPPEGWPCTKP
jgi:hypothetical protein